MSIPKKHHYLPKSYLNNWAVNGKLVRYNRPNGPKSEVYYKELSPSAVAYQPNLYKLTDIEDPIKSQEIELRVLQTIDSEAATAFQKLDRDLELALSDRMALSRFMLSLIHRTPSRLKELRNELQSRTEGTSYELMREVELKNAIYAATNRLLVELVNFEPSNRLISEFKVFKIDTSAASHKLVTSDSPINLSAQVASQDAFIMMPYKPDKLVILSHREAIVNSFASQNINALVKGVNRAIIEQSQELIITSDKKPKRLIEKLFLRPDKNTKFDNIGLIRRAPPLVDFTSTSPKFSRLNKK